MNHDISKILIDEKELDALVTKVAGEIDADFQKTGGRLLLVAILKGCSPPWRSTL